MKEQTYRMKEACTRTGLTERTIRFYIEKGLLNPQQEEMNGRVLTFFGEEDLARLEEVSLLRKAGFSIDSIATMTKYPQTVDDILLEQLADAEKNAQDSQAVLEHLRNAAGQHYSNVHQLYDALNCEPIRTLSENTAVSEPNYARFETATKEERLEGIVDHVITLRTEAKWARRKKAALRCIVTVLCMAAVLGILYGLTCIPRHISRTYDCIQYEDTSFMPLKVCGRVQVTVEGDVHFPLFQNSYFSGDITIEQVGDVTPGEEIPKVGAKYGYTLKDFYLQFGELIYVDQSGNELFLGYFERHSSNYEIFRIILQEERGQTYNPVLVTQSYIVPDLGESGNWYYWGIDFDKGGTP